MIVGIDFDNTIVCYDTLFYRESVARRLIPESTPVQKSEIRDLLRREGKEDLWTELQGFVYGPGIVRAEPFPYVFDFLKRCRRLGIKIYIVSHKTKYPYIGERHDLHAAAIDWLNKNRFFDTKETGLSRDDVIFAATKQEKISAIRELGCSFFIDDLPEFLGEETFPQRVSRILFDPNDFYPSETRFYRINSWIQAIEKVSESPRA